MKKYIVILAVLFSFFGNAQTALDSLLQKENKESIPYITTEELALKKNAILLDSREVKEFEVSHLKGATCVGYDHFKIKNIKKQIKDKNAEIVVYCSLGIRSEDIAEKLKKAGYTNVYNLYGGIFEWKNNNHAVIDASGKTTEKVHTFNKDWSIWLQKGIKVYDSVQKK